MTRSKSSQNQRAGFANSANSFSSGKNLIAAMMMKTGSSLKIPHQLTFNPATRLESTDDLPPVIAEPKSSNDSKPQQKRSLKELMLNEEDPSVPPSKQILLESSQFHLRDLHFSHNINSRIEMNIFPSINPMDSQDFTKDGMPKIKQSMRALRPPGMSEDSRVRAQQR